MENFYYLILRNLAKKPLNGNDINQKVITYPWQNPGEKKARIQIGYVGYMESWGWTVGIGVYPEEFYGELPHLIVYLCVGILIFSLLAIIIFNLLLKYSMLNVLNKINNVAQQISTGQINVEPINVKTMDEFGVLANSINIMAVNLKKIITGVSSSVTNVTDSVINVSNDIKELNSNIEEVSATTEQLSASMQETLASTLQMSEMSSEFLTTIEAIERKVQQGSQSANEINKRAEDLKVTSNKSRNSANTIYANTNEKLRSAIEKSKAVEMVNKSEKVFKFANISKDSVDELKKIMDSFNC